jgi:hypothetical protein
VFASDFEAGGSDLSSIDLGSADDDLISAVAAANPNTIVVLNTGSAVTMPWLAQVRGPEPTKPAPCRDQPHRDIIRNASVFHRRWGWWPMDGWAAESERRGLIVRTARTVAEAAIR